MAEKSIDKLQIEIEASSTDAAKEVTRLADAMKNLKSAMGGKFNNPIKDIQKSAKSSNGNNITPQDAGISTVAESKVKRLVSEKEKIGKPEKISVDTSDVKKAEQRVSKLTKLLQAVKRIAFYRAIRSGIKEITDGVATGVKNLYEWSAVVGNSFKPAMDSIATSALYAKNSLGAMVSPIIESLAPAIEFLTDRFVALLNIINQLFAALSGESSYRRAIRQTTEFSKETGKAAKAAKSFLLSIDELNVIDTSQGGGAGGQAEDFSKMFEEAQISNTIKSIADKIKELAPLVAGVGGAFAAWEISKTLLNGIDRIRKLSGKNIKFEISAKTIGLVAFLADYERLKDFLEDWRDNGASFYNVVGSISEIIGMLGDIAIFKGDFKTASLLKAIQGIGEIAAAISDISENGINFDNALLVLRGITNIAIAIGLYKGNWELAGVSLSLQGLLGVIKVLKENWEEIKKGDWSGVDKAELVINVVEFFAGLALALNLFDKIKISGKTATNIKDATGAVNGISNAIGGSNAAGEAGAAGGGGMNAGLASLAKNIGLGVVILAEVSAAALIFVGAIDLIGKLLEDVGKSWEPVKNNGGDIAEDIAIGTGILVAIGLVSYALGEAQIASGGTIAAGIALGAVTLLGIAAETVLFLDQIAKVGDKLVEIKNKWEPINSSGAEVEEYILIGTGLLASIGAASAAIGLISVASGGTIPAAIGVGAVVMGEISGAFAAFVLSIAAVASGTERLSTELEKVVPKLPQIEENMSDFADGISGFSDEISDYVKSMGGVTWSSIASGFQKIFAGNPIHGIAKDVKTTGDDTAELNQKLNVANPELEEAVTLLSNYNALITKLKEIAEENGNVSFKSDVTANTKQIGKTIIIGLSDGMSAEMPTLQSKVNNIEKSFQKMSSNAVTAISNIISALNSIPKNITTTVTIKEVTSSSKASAPAYASGGFPEDGLFFANHNELVGKFTNGKTAVANNQEIVAGIANGVENANAEQNALLREQNDLLTAILAKTGSVSIDGKTLMTSIERAQRQRGANIMAGGVLA